MDRYTKAETAEMVGVKERTIERYAKDGLIGTVYEVRLDKKGTARNIATFDLAEVLRAKEGKLTVPARPAIESPGALAVVPVAPVAPVAPVVPEPAPGALVAALAEVLHPQPDTLTLTERQASALANLPEAMIMAARKSGQLRALRTGRGWRIRRADLETWVNSL